MRLLAAYGADPIGTDALSTILLIKTCTVFQSDAESNFLSILQESHRPDVLEAVDAHGHTVLQYAATRGSDAIIQMV